MQRIETARLILQPFSNIDEQALHQLFINPYIRKYLWDDEILEPNQSKEVLELSIEHFEKDYWGFWKIQDKKSNAIMGFVGLWYFYDETQPQLLYGILQKFGGNGYASEAAKVIVKYAFEHLGFEYLLAAMDEEHHASQQLAKRIGMVFVGKKMKDGKETVFYKIEKKQF